MDKRTKEYKERTRKRVPIGGRRTKLQLSQEDMQKMLDSGYTPRWINDEQGRIQAAEGGGYEFVHPDEVPSLGEGAIHQGNQDLGSRVSKTVGRHGTRAYLMKIRTDWYLEDQAEKEKQNALVDRQLRPVQQGGQTVEGGYTPS